MLIEPTFQERLWGSRDLRAWYPRRPLEAAPIGEAWLTPAGAPVLVKLLFPADRLSVQVHPDDAQAAALGLGCGKTEMWHVLSAAPEARLGVGLRAGAELEDLELAARAGRAAECLDWFGVAAGDTIYVPAGTVHAIGAGVVLCEVQQPSDTTYRLDDYGRVDARGKQRELHIEAGLAAARRTAGGRISPGLAPGESGCLLACPFFEVRRHVARGEFAAGAVDFPRWFVNVSEAGDPEALPRGHLREVEPGGGFALPGPATLLEIRLPAS